MVLNNSNAEEYVGMCLLAYSPKFHYYPLWVVKNIDNSYAYINALWAKIPLVDGEEIYFDVATNDIQKITMCAKCEFYNCKTKFCVVMQRVMQSTDFCSYGFKKYGCEDEQK